MFLKTKIGGILAGLLLVIPTAQALDAELAKSLPEAELAKIEAYILAEAEAFAKESAKGRFQYGNPKAYVIKNKNSYQKEQKIETLAKIKAYRKIYDHKKHSSGLRRWKDDKNIKKCLEWANKAEDTHPELHPNIERALFHLGRIGEIHVFNTGFINESKGEYLDEYIFCRGIPEFQQ